QWRTIRGDDTGYRRVGKIAGRDQQRISKFRHKRDQLCRLSIQLKLDGIGKKDSGFMDIFNKKARVIITCSKRLSPYLEREVSELGFGIERTFPTGVELSVTVNECIRLNLNLRCASQILYSLKTFAANSP